MAGKAKKKSRRERWQAPVTALAQHPWLWRLSWEHGGTTRPDRPSRMPTYGTPDWSLWASLPEWKVVEHLLPLLFEHDPDRARNAPYLCQAWCHRNLDRPEVRTVRMVLEAVGQQFGRPNRHPLSGKQTIVYGYTVQPLAFVRWAKANPIVDVPPPLATAVGLAEPASPPTPIPELSNRLERRKREGFATVVAMRFAGLEIKGNQGAAGLGFEGDTTIEGYLADSQSWGTKWKELEAWAEGDGDWATVFAKLRQWVRAAEE